MPFVSRHYLDRLERDLLHAIARAEKAEQSLANERLRADELVGAERQSKDSLILQLTSRVVTKHGGYGLEVAPRKPAPAPHPKGFIREPNEHDLAKLDYYRDCYRQAGKSEDEAVALWEAEMRGESVSYEYEREQ